MWIDVKVVGASSWRCDEGLEILCVNNVMPAQLWTACCDQSCMELNCQAWIVFREHIVYIKEKNASH